MKLSFRIASGTKVFRSIFSMSSSLLISNSASVSSDLKSPWHISNDSTSTSTFSVSTEHSSCFVSSEDLPYHQTNLPIPKTIFYKKQKKQANQNHFHHSWKIFMYMI